MTTILQINNISKSFNGLAVLTDVSLSLAQGTITALFGENGSGKTTLFHVISGFLKADKGEVRYREQELNGKTPVEIAALGVGRIWQTPRVCRTLPVLDNLLLATRDHPGENWLNYFLRLRLIFREERRRKDLAEQVAADVGLAGKLGNTAGSLSFGQQKLLSIGMLLMNDAELLMLDEPFAGVHPLMVDHIAAVLTLLKTKGKTVFLIEHDRTRARNISNLVITLSKDKVTQETVAQP